MYYKINQIPHIRVFNAIDNDVFFVDNNLIFGSDRKNQICQLKENCDQLLILNSNLIFLNEYNRIMLSYPNEVSLDYPISRIIDKKIYYYLKTKPKRTYGVYESGQKVVESNNISGNYKFTKLYL